MSSDIAKTCSTSLRESSQFLIVRPIDSAWHDLMYLDLFVLLEQVRIYRNAVVVKISDCKSVPQEGSVMPVIDIESKAFSYETRENVALMMA